RRAGPRRKRPRQCAPAADGEGERMSDGLVMLAPLSLEARAIRRGAPWAEVRHIGMGPRKASHSAEQLVSQSPDRPWMVAGFCGALDPDLEPGDIVLASELRTPDGATVPCDDPTILAGVLRRAGLAVRVAPIACSEKIVTGE